MGTLNEQRFKASLGKSGSRVVIALPFEPNEAWGEKQRHTVTGTIGGYRVRGHLDSDENGYFLPLGPAWLRDNPPAEGLSVEVVLAPEGPQLATMPEDIVAALQAEPQAQQFFESLSTYYRKGYLTWINGARKPEARAARIGEMVDLLKAGQKQR